MKINGQEARQEKSKFNAYINNIVSQQLDAIDQGEEIKLETIEKTIAISNKVANIPARYSKAMMCDFDWGEAGNKARDFIKDPRDRIFLLFGGTGVGKTTLQCASIHERAVNGENASYYFNDRLLMPILRTTRSFSARENEAAFIQRISSYPYLCIDEIGASSNLKEEAEFLTNVICARYDNELPTFMATNLSPSNFKLFMCGLDLAGNYSKEMIQSLTSTNATLNRIKSLAIQCSLKGDSHR